MNELLTIDCGNVWRWPHIPYTCKLEIKYFLSFRYQPPASSNQQTMVQSWSTIYLWKLKLYTWCCSGKLLSFTFRFNLTSTLSTIPYSSVVIDIDSCLVIITWLSWLDCCLRKTSPWTGLVAITLLKQWPINRKNYEIKLQ